MESQWSPWSYLRESERYTMLPYGDHIDSASHGLASWCRVWELLFHLIWMKQGKAFCSHGKLSE